MAERPSAPVEPKIPGAEQPVYEKQLGNIRFVFESAPDRGKVLRVSDITNNQYSSSWQKDLPTIERFIEVTVGGQNMGTENTEQNAWDIENIVDSEGRNFVPMDQYVVQAWLPANNSCGALLKPAFDPLPCTKIYEVSKRSTGLKIRVKAAQNSISDNISSGKVESALLDLIVK
jgi:hypothetical protein